MWVEIAARARIELERSSALSGGFIGLPLGYLTRIFHEDARGELDCDYYVP